MFWGITLENGKRYSQKVDDAFHVSMAALEFNTQESEKKKNVSVMIEHNKSEFLLCSLRHGTNVQQHLDLNFMEGEEVTFFISGPGTVHLTGFLHDKEEYDDDEDYIDEDDSDSEESDEEIESGDDIKASLKRKVAAIQLKNNKKTKIVDFNDLSDEELVEDDEEESDDNLKALQFNKKKAVSNKAVEKIKNGGKNVQSPKNAKNAKQTPNTPQNAKQSSANGPETPNSEGLTASAKKRRKRKKKSLGGGGDVSIDAEQPKTPSDALKKAETAPTPKKVAGTAATPKKMADKAATPKNVRKIVGGTSVEDAVVGNGPVAKRGKFVQIAYVGRLLNNKVFDSSKKGSPLGFRVGGGEVIKGLDLGIEGMKVGGKRKLVIPAHQAYGKAASGPIPSNSTLQFEIELKSVK